MATKKTQPTALVKWDEELAKQAEIAASMEANTSGGQFFSLKGGILSWQDVPLPGNQMAVIILDSILENVYYKERYDADILQNPTCFAFGREEKTMSPHAVVTEAGNSQHDQCIGCPMNEYGTADVGKGKACRNTRRLGMIPAGTFNAAGKFEFNENLEYYENMAVGMMRLPVTSVKGYASFVKQVAGALHRPPFGIATKIKVIPDPKSQFKVIFEPIIILPNEFMSVIMKRHEEVKSTIDFPYQPNEEESMIPKHNNRSMMKQTANRKARKY